MAVSNATETKRTGRRPGETRTRDAILDAARTQFAARGFDRTSLRSVAAEAGVDQALIVYFFRSKIGLFIEAVELPIDPRAAIPAVVEGPREELGERVARFVIGVLQNDQARATVLAIVRAATSEPEAARMVRERLMQELWGPLARALGVNDAELRVSLVGSQVIGLVLARYVVGVEPLASQPPDSVASMIAPTLQRYLVEGLVANS